MSILVIGGDRIEPIKSVLYDLGATDIKHWDARRQSDNHKSLPMNLDCIVMLTNFLKHNAMLHFKKQAKKRNIPLVCAKRSESSVYSKYIQIMGEKQGKIIYKSFYSQKAKLTFSYFSTKKY